MADNETVEAVVVAAMSAAYGEPVNAADVQAEEFTIPVVTGDDMKAACRVTIALMLARIERGAGYVCDCLRWPEMEAIRRDWGLP